VNLVTYFRLLMPWVLPVDVTRAIYLDADLLIRRDLGRLWDQPLEGSACLAAPDTAAPYIDARAGLTNFDRCHRFLAAVEPIPNHRELGLCPTGKYFNAGVLVVDLETWRAERVAERSLACLREHAEHVRWWDQYALNVVLAGQWNELDVRWNQGVQAYTFPTWRESPLERDLFAALRSDPWIVHFTSQDKPWQYFCRHPFRGDYFAEIDRTAWRGWRPGFPPSRGLKQWWKYHVAPARQVVKVAVVRTSRIVRAARRAA
jgi:lipopolysaccharide biosynthesis glycosyltransferase